MLYHKISVFQNIKHSSIPVGEMTLEQCVTSFKHKDTIELMRLLPKESQDFKDLKASLPCFTPSGLFSVRNLRGLIQHSHSLCIEWDHIEEPAAFRDSLDGYSFIRFAALSCSGRGVYAIVDIVQPELHTEYFRALQDYFIREGKPIDPSGKDVTRLRVASYDPNYLLRPYVKPWDTILPPQKPRREYTPMVAPEGDQRQRLFLVGLDYIECYGRDITVGRNTWLGLAALCSHLFGAAGEDYFLRLSRFHIHYDEKEARKAYADMSGKTSHGIGVFLSACTRAGIPDVKELLIKKGWYR